MRLTKLLVPFACLIVAPIASSQNDYSVCSKMISDAAHNVGITTASYDYADSISGSKTANKMAHSRATISTCRLS